MDGSLTVDGSLKVSPGTLNACAGRSQTIGESVSALAGRAADSCAQAAGPHAGWQFGAALTALAPLWRRQLTGQGTALSGAGEKLRTSSGLYTAAESANADLARSLPSLAGAAT